MLFPTQEELNETIERVYTDAGTETKLTTWKSAADAISAWFKEYAENLSTNIDLAAAGDYRAFYFKRDAMRLVHRHHVMAQVRLFTMLFPQKRKIWGMQRVDTRKPFNGELRGGVIVGKRCGHEAWKRKRGRPVLSKTEWIKREKKRRDKRRKGVWTWKKLDAPIVPPEVYGGRPTTGENFSAQKGGHGHSGVDSYLESKQTEMLKELTAEFIKKGGEEFAHWATHEGIAKAKEWWKNFCETTIPNH